MGESHARSAEEGWNPGEVWPVPVECLLNGMTTDTHLMFGGGHMFPPHFRHRFQPPVHLPSAHLGPLPGSINVNVSIPLASHSMVDTGQVNETVSPSVAVQESNGQVPHNIPQPLPIDNSDVLDDESDEASDDEDDDEVDDDVSLTMGHTHEQHTSQIGIEHAMENDSLVQCEVIRNSLQQRQQPMMPIVDNGSLMQQQCLQQKQPNEPRHDHAGHSQSIHTLSMSMTDDFSSQNSLGDSDPNSGFSVHGKMYFEGRVVLHLKQWTDPQSSDNNSLGIGGSENEFSSCAEQQHQKRHIHGCAFCRLKSPASHESHRSQKEAHRHTVKGVLFTFEDCIIVELYPEPPNNTAETKHPPPPSAPEPQQQKHNPMSDPITSYMSPAVPIQTQQEQAKKFLHHLEVNCLADPVAMPTENPTEKDTVTAQQSQTTEDHGWWDECEFSDDLKRGEVDDNQDPNSNRTDSSCIAELKLQNQETQEDDSDYKIKPKCPHNSDTFLTTSELESHVCRSHSDVLLEEVDLASGPNSVHVGSISGNDSVAAIQSSDESQQSSIPDSPTQSVEKIVAGKRISNFKNSKLRHPCSMCDKTFHLKKALKQHVEQVHSDGNSFCSTLGDQQFTDDKRHRKQPCHSKDLMNHEKQSVPFGKIFPKSIPHIAVEISGSNSACSTDDKATSDEDDSKDCEIAEGKMLRRTGRKIRSSLENAPDESSSGQENHEIAPENSGDEEDEMKLPVHAAGKNKRKNEKPFKCDVCGKLFTVERRLQNHKISHNADRSSQCEKCGKRFVRKDKLMRHMYVHSEEKLFSCEICQKRFSRRDKLSDHLKSHGGADEIHKCPMCQKQFLRPDILKQHVKLHTVGNKHQCSECLRFVTGKDRLEKHMARHKEAKALGQTLLCPLCTKYFIQKQSLKAHVKKFHPDANINLDAPDSEPLEDQLQGQQAEHHLQIDLDSNDTPKMGGSKKSGAFECDHCQKQFTKKQTLKKHMRKHQITHVKSPDDSFVTSPSPEEDDCLHMHLPESNSPGDNILAPAVAPSNSALSPAHSILPTTQSPNPPINIGNTNSPSNDLNATPPAHIPLPQQNILQQHPNQCSHLQHVSHGNLPHHHHSHHHLLAHTGHPSQGPQISTMALPSGQLHTNLSQHVSVPMQHHVNMATQQSMCGPSYVLTYPHFTYQ